MTNSKKDSELEDIYRRCDVSNNRTDNPMSLDEFLQAINSKYITKQSVIGMIGEDEQPDTSGGVAIMAIYNARNQLRAELRELLKGDKDG